MITVTRRRDIMNLADVEEWIEPAWRTIRETLPDDFDTVTGIIEVNSRRIVGGDIDRKLMDGDAVDLVDTPGEPATIAIWTIAGIGLIASLTSTVLAITNKPRLAIPGVPQDDVLGRPTFSGVHTTIGPGQVIPLIYGELRVGGHIIESYTQPRYQVRASDPTVTEITADTESVESGDPLHRRIVWGHGPVESVSSLEIDGNAIADIAGVLHESHLGTTAQGWLVGFESTRNTYLVDQDVLYATSRTTTTSIFTRRWAIQFRFKSGLYEVGTNGDMQERSVDLRVSYRLAGSVGAYTTYKQVTATAAQRAPYDVWFEGPDLGDGKWEVQCERLTVDSSGSSISDVVTLYNRVEVDAVDAQAHPGLAETGFRQIPQGQMPAPRNYTAIVKGRNNVRVYTDTSTYTEIWTDSPGWCFLNWLMSEMHGEGKFWTYDDNVDLQSFIDMATYCTAQGFAFNHEFRSQHTRSEMASIFERASNSRFVEEGGVWRAITMDDASAVLAFGTGNYIRDSLVWKLESTQERASRLTGRFKNESDEYRVDVRTVVDETFAEGGQYIDSEAELWGATDPQQVKKLLLLELNWNRLSDESIEFETGIRGMGLRPGDIFRFASPTGGVGVASGRLRSVADAGATLVLDSEVTLDSAKSYTLRVQHTDDGFAHTSEALALTSVHDEATVLVTTSGAWTQEPVAGEVYAAVEDTEGDQLFRCTSRRVDENLSVRVTAAKHDSAIDTVTVPAEDTLPTRQTDDPRKFPDPVANLTLGSRWTLKGALSGTNKEAIIDVAWSPPTTGGPASFIAYTIFIRPSSSGVYRNIATVTGTTEFSIGPGVFSIRSGDSFDVAVAAGTIAGSRQSLADAASKSITIPAP